MPRVLDDITRTEAIQSDLGIQKPYRNVPGAKIAMACKTDRALRVNGRIDGGCIELFQKLTVNETTAKGRLALDLMEGTEVSLETISAVARNPVRVSRFPCINHILSAYQTTCSLISWIRPQFLKQLAFCHSLCGIQPQQEHCHASNNRNRLNNCTVQTEMIRPTILARMK
jgi:hypothetical protein